MSDVQIQAAIDAYLRGRHDLLELSKEHPGRIGGNDNIIGRIGEFIALRFLEAKGQKPVKVEGSSNPGFDLVDDRKIRTQVKVITAENIRGRSVRLQDPWDQLVLIELGDGYQPIRIGVLSKHEHTRACEENAGWSATPIVRRSMLGSKGIVGRYGRVYEGDEIAV